MGKKYFTISFDDGIEQDKRIIALMEKYGIRGTFNINSGMFGVRKLIHRLPGTDLGLAGKEGQKNTVDAIRMTREEAAEVYARDFIEVASHGTNHVRENAISEEELLHEVMDDVKVLSEMFGYPIRGHIFPYGAQSEEVLYAMKEAGICYGRAVMPDKKAKDFRLQADYGVITPTCSHLDKAAEEKLQKFIEMKVTDTDPDQVFYMWGHGYELDYGTEMGCDAHLEKLFAMAAGADDVIFVTNGEMIDALNANGAGIGVCRKYPKDALPIWGDKIPYNTGELKKRLMKLSGIPDALILPGFFQDVFGTKITADRSRLDTHSYKNWIAKGNESLFMDDIPMLHPFLTEGADTAVVIAPGGAFCDKAMDGEGEKIARFLNRNGISAFVLDYRLNPYQAPVCYLDMQRAIRYVRYHAAEFGLDPHRIGAMGFSAGGYVAGAATLLLKNAAVNEPGYEADEIDSVDGRADFLGMLYPVTGFYHNPSMLCLLAGEDFFDPRKRSKAMEAYDLTDHLDVDCPPQFLCYGSKDPLKDMIDYDRKLKELDLPHRTLVIDGVGHGFALEKEKFNFWGDAFVEWIRGL